MKILVREQGDSHLVKIRIFGQKRNYGQNIAFLTTVPFLTKISNFNQMRVSLFSDQNFHFFFDKNGPLLGLPLISTPCNFLLPYLFCIYIQRLFFGHFWLLFNNALRIIYRIWDHLQNKNFMILILF